MALPARIESLTGLGAQGLLLVGHGTRDPEGLKEFHEVAAAVARRPPTDVKSAIQIIIAANPTKMISAMMCMQASPGSLTDH